MSTARQDQLRARRMGIDTYHEPVAFMRENCAVCRAEGFKAMARVRIAHDERSIIATLNVVRGQSLAPSEIGLSEAAWHALGSHSGDLVSVSHPEPVESFSSVRSKIYGKPFDAAALHDVVRDITAGRYSSIEIAAFVTACAGNHMTLEETVALTRAMVDSGTRLAWQQNPVMDKHCVGGLPGNRTTPILVAIAAACGLTIPKTSSRAITSPAGTADTMAVLAPVELTLQHIRRVVDSEGGCVVWGGSIALSPADDRLIQVERPLEIDSSGQLTASVLSKKLAAGSTHLLIDMPVGATAKVRSAAAADVLQHSLEAAGAALGLQTRVVRTDGTQPVGRGIGPVLEAIDVLAVLRNGAGAPPDLRQRALLLAGHLLELGGKAAAGDGIALARKTLDSGAAWKKFEAICIAQGGLRKPRRAPHRRPVVAPCAGIVGSIDNRRLARTAKLAGAPLSPAAGVELCVRLGQRVEADAPVYLIHAEAPGELDYAAAYAAAHPEIVSVKEPS
ncbi:MAG: thymidine phosphorylase family protein [Gammaproteobacteria bacterium]|nr:thymidine phosphorylase family protein [Gammaproteobacteria bacterium]